MTKPLTPAEVLALVPQRRPMRFIDAIEELNDDHITAVYTWKDEDCSGHFPGNPVVPGVKLIEMAAQVGNFAWGLYHKTRSSPAEDIKGFVGVFTGVEEGTFKRVVRPGDRVRAEARFGEDGFFRDNKVLAEVQIRLQGGPADGELVFEGLTSGMLIPRSEP